MFFGLPWTLVLYGDRGNYHSGHRAVQEKENDCYLYKVIDVRLESTLLERMLGLGTIHCFTGDVTDPDLKLLHIKHAKEIKDYILKQSEQERMKRRTVNMQHLDGNGDEPDGRKRQLQIARKVKAVLIKTALPFWWLFLSTA